MLQTVIALFFLTKNRITKNPPQAPTNSRFRVNLFINAFHIVDPIPTLQKPQKIIYYFIRYHPVPHQEKVIRTIDRRLDPWTKNVFLVYGSNTAVYRGLDSVNSHMHGLWGHIYYCLHVIVLSAIAIVSMMSIDAIYSYKISLLFATIFTNKNDFRLFANLFGKKTRFKTEYQTIELERQDDNN